MEEVKDGFLERRKKEKILSSGLQPAQQKDIGNVSYVVAVAKQYMKGP